MEINNVVLKFGRQSDYHYYADVSYDIVFNDYEIQENREHIEYISLFNEENTLDSYCLKYSTINNEFSNISHKDIGISDTFIMKVLDSDDQSIIRPTTQVQHRRHETRGPSSFEMVEGNEVIRAIIFVIPKDAGTMAISKPVILDIDK